MACIYSEVGQGNLGHGKVYENMVLPQRMRTYKMEEQRTSVGWQVAGKEDPRGPGSGAFPHLFEVYAFP
jgi:hypothetical protein